ncbi:MAG: arginine--tRNA ligase, partial [Myxococcota bacterium]
PIKTRDGKAITLKSLLDEAEERAEALMIEMGLDRKLIAELKPTIGIGAVKYADLSQNRTSNYQFDFDKMVALTGNCCPYLQYQHARVCSVFRKGEVDERKLRGPIRIEHDAERSLALRLLRFGEVVHQAVEQSLPHFISDHLYGLARDYASFYDACPILKAEGETQASRLALAALTARQLRRGLGLLGIHAPDRM